jgi:hypothetical protein
MPEHLNVPETDKIGKMYMRNQAQAQLHFFEERSRKDIRNLIHMVRMWAQEKNGYRLAYLSALHAIACKNAATSQDKDRQGTGSIVFYAFPQELVNKIVERTGGRPITVAVPELCDGEVEIDAEGRIFLVAAFPNGDGSLHERRIFHMQVTEKLDSANAEILRFALQKLNEPLG